MYYTHHIEPNSNWTVEQVMQWCALRSARAVDDGYRSAADDLRRQLEAGAEELLSALEREEEDGGDDEEQEENASNNNNNNGKTTGKGILKNPTSTTAKQGDKANKKKNATTKGNSKSDDGTTTTTTIRVAVVGGGMYDGREFELTMRPSNGKGGRGGAGGGGECYVGRSQGKKFKTNGVSLPRDFEVSTTHGKFSVTIAEDGDEYRYWYTDTGSTNGTHFNDVMLEPDVPLRLHHGYVLQVGQSLLRISLPDK